MVEKSLKVEKITNGTVIDHIASGMALKVLKILGITGEDGDIVSIDVDISLALDLNLRSIQSQDHLVLAILVGVLDGLLARFVGQDDLVPALGHKQLDVIFIVVCL